MLKQVVIALLISVVPPLALGAEYRVEARLEKDASHIEEVGKLRFESGHEARTRMIIPKQGGRLPAMVVLAGFEKPMAGLDALMAKAPLILAGIEYPFQSNKQFQSVFELLGALAEGKRMIHETLEGLSALKDVLRVHERVDAGRISIAGASFGSFLATIAASRWPDSFKGLILIHGFADIPATAAHNLARALKEDLGILAYPVSWLGSQIAWLYMNLPSPEALLRALRTDQSVLVISPISDVRVPDQVVRSLWDSVSSSHARAERVQLGGEHIDVSNTPLLGEVSAYTESWLRRNNLLNI